ncbi:hypothetical protein Q5427_11115 [Brochothrix thermosphacta]|uniref:hypothetical protein n=1 Tax=Brochothrix thermosphacta TaxID=2756 RepID=UPI00271238F9|nr:hypothetical protein [Brochothrix thermosphacta]MDO7864839.1 hypothetical protein [Brochothrix thermosphacta]
MDKETEVKLGEQYAPSDFFKGAELFIKEQTSWNDIIKKAMEPVTQALDYQLPQTQAFKKMSSNLSVMSALDNHISSILGRLKNHQDLWIANYNKDYKWFIFHGIAMEDYQTAAISEDVDKHFHGMYTEDDFLLLKDSLDSLVTSEWGEDIAHIINFANEDIEKNYVAILPFLYMMVERKIRSYKKYKFNEFSLNGTVKKIEENINSDITMGLQKESSRVILESIKATKIDKFGKFDRHAKEKERAFNRNSVMHGSISPKYWDFMDFVKLVNATTFMLLWMPAYTGYDELE